MQSVDQAMMNSSSRTTHAVRHQATYNAIYEAFHHKKLVPAFLHDAHGYCLRISMLLFISSYHATAAEIIQTPALTLPFVKLPGPNSGGYPLLFLLLLETRSAEAIRLEKIGGSLHQENVFIAYHFENVPIELPETLACSKVSSIIKFNANATQLA
jgi:hypothetical protein